MAGRYIYSKNIKTPDTNRKYLESTIYPKIRPNDNDMYIISEQGDRLDILASKYYNEPDMWWVIAVANNINDATFYVEPGIQLRIPSNMSAILNDLERINK
jgi:hypothetical protein